MGEGRKGGVIKNKEEVREGQGSERGAREIEGMRRMLNK
jgi:hypothetical protein